MGIYFSYQIESKSKIGNILVLPWLFSPCSEDRNPLFDRNTTTGGFVLALTFIDGKSSSLTRGPESEKEGYFVK